MKIITFKKKKRKLLTKQQQESYEKAKVGYISKESLLSNYLKDKKYCKVRDHCHYVDKYRCATHSICNLKYKFFTENLLAIEMKKNRDTCE